MAEIPKNTEEMRRFIEAVYGSTTPTYTDAEPTEIPENIKNVRLLSHNLQMLGSDRLSILFGDRCASEIVLENCALLDKKIDQGEYEVVQTISEALQTVLSKVEPDKYELAGLKEDDIRILDKSITILTESSSINKEIVDKKQSILLGLFEELTNMVTRWEMLKESGDGQTEEFASGVELGVMRSASELKEVIDRYKDNILKTDMGKKDVF
jgi:hypothetical protein